MKLPYKLNVYVVALLIPLLLTPHVTQAKTAPDRVALLETIQVLLAKVQNLQLLLTAQQTAVSYVPKTDFLDNFPGDIKYLYEIDEELQLPPSAPNRHERYVEQLNTIMPEKYRAYIDQFVVFDNHPNDMAAFAAVAYDGKDATWVYGIEVAEINESPTSDASIELMIHEFAHIFTLDQLITLRQRTTGCHEYFDTTGCFGSGSHLGQFVELFWDDELLDELVIANESRNVRRELTQLYKRYDSEFVTEYAATTPAEDFAESFAWYVLDLDAERGTVAEEKIEFMSQFSSIRAYKEHITNQL
jgi:hypothetical protein